MENRKIAEEIIRQLQLFLLAGYMVFFLESGMNSSGYCEKLLYIKIESSIWKTSFSALRRQSDCLFYFRYITKE